ncbi:aminoglycoside phosphotransferase family protein [Nioella sp. MMSF_3534]|uniref:aminoglycoside phosphotransferase family protein n=1 Tax=Nioella sp. MMSF_3534 TaxID=3046720 RepID=UPI00273E1045|nr:phosphotransferase [Nioella sp. MMSF_3534]
MSAPVQEFLDANGWGNATRVPLAGDASARRYERLTLGDARAVLMLAPPEDRAAFDAFLSIAAKLRAMALSTPLIIGSDKDRGLMLLEDFGDRSFATLGPDLMEAGLAAADVLIHLARHPEGWSLPALTPHVMAEMTRIALPDGTDADAALTEMQAQFARVFTAPLVPTLRDVHAENLLWLPDRLGLTRVGLLDFQDAVLAPPGYDLVSFIKDARREIPADIAAAMTARYINALAIDEDGFAEQSALLSFQRNLRILGVFRRLARNRGKPVYLIHLPRVFAHVTDALEHPALTDLAGAMGPLLPGLRP